MWDVVSKHARQVLPIYSADTDLEKATDPHQAMSSGFEV